MTQASPAPGSDAAQVRGLMRAGRFAEAAQLCSARLANHPDDREALYSLAVCARRLGDAAGAAAALERLLALAPDHARAHQELGRGLAAIGKTREAAAAFERAVTLNPSLHAAWTALAGLTDYPRRAEAERQAAFWGGLRPELNAAASHYHEQRYAPAEALCRDVLRSDPENADGLWLLALLAQKFGALQDAARLLENALRHDPAHTRARFELVGVLQKRQQFRAAAAEAQVLLAQEPESPAGHVALGGALQGSGAFAEALAAYDQALALAPLVPSIVVARGHLLKTLGRTPEAVAAYHAAIAARPDCGDAYWSLANLKTYAFAPDEIDRLRAAVDDPRLSPEDRVPFCFALGKALEDRGAAAEAFACYARGNDLRKREHIYRHEIIAAELDAQERLCTPDFFAERADFGVPDADPIFIVGMPRAGSTLLEQILASHSAVDGTMELSAIIAMANALGGRGGPGYPQALERLTRDQSRELGAAYLAETREHRQGRPFFIDKMPNNFRHIALIHLILPNARIIDARRDALACGFSNFKQLYAEGQEFSYDLRHIGAYYRAYVDIMAHWDAVLPERVLRVQHEDVVADLDLAVRRLLDHCGLPFEPGCLRFWETDRAVRTPSSEQVRRPISAAGLEAWRAFEPFLGDLVEALGPLASGAAR
jgi:tetratricopeptide (TPR) repeat protein